MQANNATKMSSYSNKGLENKIIELKENNIKLMLEMIENILYKFHHSSINDVFNYFQQSPSLALMEKQTDQLVKLINLVTTKLIY